MPRNNIESMLMTDEDTQRTIRVVLKSIFDKVKFIDGRVENYEMRGGMLDFTEINVKNLYEELFGVPIDQD